MSTIHPTTARASSSPAQVCDQVRTSGSLRSATSNGPAILQTCAFFLHGVKHTHLTNESERLTEGAELKALQLELSNKALVVFSSER